MFKPSTHSFAAAALTLSSFCLEARAQVAEPAHAGSAGVSVQTDNAQVPVAPSAHVAAPAAPAPAAPTAHAEASAPKANPPPNPEPKHDTPFLARDADGNLITHDDSAGFGRRRQWAFSSDAALSVQRQTTSHEHGAVTTINLAPAADYFVLKNLSVGGTIGVTYTRSGGNSSTRFAIGPRVGYNFEISRMLSVWPKLGFSYAYTSSDAGNQTSVVPSNCTDGSQTNVVTSGCNVVVNRTHSVDQNAVALNIFIPVMVHPAPHFFAGFGPFLDTDLSGDHRSTVWGLKLTMGGWINPKKAG